MKCPACYSKIGPFDRSCPCGWGAAVVNAPPSHDCGWPDCQAPALASVTASGKRVNLCKVHYSEFFGRQALAGARAKGLTSPEDCREWLKANRLKPMKFPNPEVSDETAP